MPNIANGMLTIPSGPFVEADVDVEIWRYSYYGEHMYLANLCALPTETLASSRGRYMVH